MDSGTNFWQSELFGRLQKMLAGGQPVYLVGGAVRDALLNRPVHDVDFAVTGEVRSVARRAANQLGASFYMLDEERNTARVIEHRGGEMVVMDFASLRAASLEDDLRSRDLTVNAMAVDMAAPAELIDPLGGLVDLRERRIRACSSYSFQGDAVRVLRAIRLALDLKFKIETDTYRLMEEAVPLVERVSPERQRDELFRMLSGSNVVTAVRMLDRLGALDMVMPDLSAMKGVPQSPPHTLDVWEHTLAVLRELETLFHLLVDDFDPESTANLTHSTATVMLGRFRSRLQAHYLKSLNPNRSLRSLVFLAALYHDAGKPSTFQLDESGRIRFFEHERIGGRTISRWAHQAGLSQLESARVEEIVYHHMRIHHLMNAGPDQPSRRSIYRYFKATGEAGVDICLLSLADTLGMYNNIPSMPQEAWRRELEICGQLLDAWFERPAEIVKPPRLLTGSDLMADFNLLPGPVVGELLELIQEAQACGEIDSREQAVQLARAWLEKHQPGVKKGS